MSTVALALTSTLDLHSTRRFTFVPPPNPPPHTPTFRFRRPQCIIFASQLCDRDPPPAPAISVSYEEFTCEDELLAAVRLRTRTFYEFRDSLGVEDHKRRLEAREFVALKERVEGKSAGFWRVSCVNATLALPVDAGGFGHARDLCSACKFSFGGEDRVVVGTLDVNQCLRMVDELAGNKPEGMGIDIKRAYLSNVCVAREFQRNGLAYALIRKSKKLAKSWGITDLYVHVAVDNESAKRLYAKSGFIYESEEQASQARLLGRPRRYLLLGRSHSNG